MDPLAAGVLGAVVVTWATFAPCFLWIFLGAPYIERLRGNVRLGAALQTITAAVVGVIANLAVTFAVRTLFDQVRGVDVVGRHDPGARVVLGRHLRGGGCDGVLRGTLAPEVEDHPGRGGQRSRWVSW